MDPDPHNSMLRMLLDDTITPEQMEMELFQWSTGTTTTLQTQHHEGTPDCTGAWSAVRGADSIFWPELENEIVAYLAWNPFTEAGPCLFDCGFYEGGPQCAGTPPDTPEAPGPDEDPGPDDDAPPGEPDNPSPSPPASSPETPTGGSTDTTETASEGPTSHELLKAAKHAEKVDRMKVMAYGYCPLHSGYTTKMFSERGRRLKPDGTPYQGVYYKTVRDVLMQRTKCTCAPLKVLT